MIKFSSRAAADLWMTDTHGRRLLDIIGKTKAERGAIAVPEIPAALAALRAAIEAERRGQAGDIETPDDEDAREQQAQAVDLGRRAYPLMDMLERAAKREVEVLWGV